ncbi:formylglycine-generating enzyme family protein [Vibrio cholerae]
MINNLISEVEDLLVEHNKQVNIAKEINESTEFEAMGLVPNILGLYNQLNHELFIKLSRHDTYTLVNVVESRSHHVFERICAGNILALRGDPRISAIPELVNIPEQEITLGINVERADDLFRQDASLGVKRDWILKETPKNSVNVLEFKISRFPITNSQYLTFLLETNYEAIPSSWRYGRFPLEASNHPVYTVSEKDALQYCEWLSSKINCKVSLPSEKQWISSCVSADNRGDNYIWGNKFEPFYSNTNEMLICGTTPVGVFIEGQSPHGVHDLIGNVEEYTSTFYAPFEGGEIIKDDLYNILGNYRVAKGGAFNRFRDLARVQRRHGAYPSSLYAMGFRIIIEENNLV